MYSYDHLYKHLIHIHLHMHAHLYAEHNDTIKTSDTVLRKIYLSLYLKGCVWEGVGDRTELQRIDPHSIGHNRVSFPFSSTAQLGARGPTLLGAGFPYHILSPTGLVSKLIWSPTATAQSGTWWPTLLGAEFLYHIFSPTGLVSKLTDFLSSPSYIIVHAHLLVDVTILHSLNPSTVKAIISRLFLDRVHLLFI